MGGLERTSYLDTPNCCDNIDAPALRAIRLYGEFMGRPEILANIIRNYNGDISMSTLKDYLLKIRGAEVDLYIEKEASRGTKISQEDEKEFSKLLKQYTNHGEIKDLSIKEEKRILEPFNNPDERIKILHELLPYHYCIIIALAQNLSKKTSLPINELIQAGLLNVIKRFDNFRHEYRFSNFCAVVGLSGILGCIQKCENTVLIPVHIQYFVDKAIKVLENEEQTRQTTLSNEQKLDIIANIIKGSNKVDEKNLQLTAKKVLDVIDGGYVEISERILQENATTPLMTPEELLIEKHKRVIIGEIMQKLPPREAKVVIDRFLMDITLGKIAEELGITRETVRQIERRALLKLRNLGYGKFLETFLES